MGYAEKMLYSNATEDTGHSLADSSGVRSSEVEVFERRKKT